MHRIAYFKLPFLLFLILILSDKECLGEISVSGKLYDLWGGARCMALNGDFAYASCSTGIHVLDISEPDNPIELSCYYPPDTCVFFEIALKDTLGLILSYDYLFIYNLSDPLHPDYVSSFNLENYRPEEIELMNSLAYIATEDSGLVVIDIINPNEPCEVSTTEIPDGSIRDFCIEGELAFVAIYRMGIQIIDISDPANPVLYDTLRASDCVSHMDTKDSYLYVAFNENFYIYDLSDLRNIRLVGSMETPHDIEALVVVDNYAILKALLDDMLVIDVSNPDNLSEVGHIGVGGYYNLGQSLVYRDEYIYNLTGVNGLWILDFHEPEALQIVGNIGSRGPLRSVCVQDDLAYLRDRRGGLLVVDISDVANPYEVSQLELEDQNDGKLKVVGEYVYIINPNRGVEFVNVSDPSNLEYAGILDNLPGGNELQVHGDLLLMSNDSTFLDIIDISVPGTPELLSSYDVGLDPYGMAAIGDYVYMVDRDEGILILDISDPTFPRVERFFNPFGSGSGSIFIDEEMGIAAWFTGPSEQRGTYLLDVSDPLEPEIIGFVSTTGGIYNIYNGHLILVDTRGYFYTYNIENPGHPYQTGYYHYDEYIGDLDVQDGYLFAAHSSHFLIYNCTDVLPVGIEQAPESRNCFLNLYPNPANSVFTIDYQVSNSSDVGIAIYDVYGNLVEQLLSTRLLPAGEHQISWNAEQLASGNYFIKIDRGVTSATRSISIIK